MTITSTSRPLSLLPHFTQFHASGKRRLAPSLHVTFQTNQTPNSNFISSIYKHSTPLIMDGTTAGWGDDTAPSAKKPATTSSWNDGWASSSSPAQQPPSTMEDVYRTRFGESLSSSLPARPSKNNQNPTVTYTPSQLKTIGQQCSQRLPPANAVQAMFLYEMQRQTESEQLFKNQMFRLARNEDATTVQTKRIDELEAKTAQLERQMKSRDVEDRLATSKSTMQMLDEKLSAVLKKVEGMEGGLRELQAEMEMEKKRKDSVFAPKDNSDLVKTMKEEIDVLFDDRDGILKMITGLKEQLASIESASTVPASSTNTANNMPGGWTDDAIEPIFEEALLDTMSPPPNNENNNYTITSTPNNGTSTTIAPHARAQTGTQTQRLPLRTTTNQTPLNLAVPKGKAAVGLRDSDHAPPPVPAPSNLHSFSPGRPWAS